MRGRNRYPMKYRDKTNLEIALCLASFVLLGIPGIAIAVFVIYYFRKQNSIFQISDETILSILISQQNKINKYKNFFGILVLYFFHMGIIISISIILINILSKNFDVYIVKLLFGVIYIFTNYYNANIEPSEYISYFYYECIILNFFIILVIVPNYYKIIMNSILYLFIRQRERKIGFGVIFSGLLIFLSLLLSYFWFLEFGYREHWAVAAKLLYALSAGVRFAGLNLLVLFIVILVAHCDPRLRRALDANIAPDQRSDFNHPLPRAVVEIDVARRDGEPPTSPLIPKSVMSDS